MRSATEARDDDGAVHGDAHGATTAALTVNYTVGGTATAGSDYAAWPERRAGGAAAATMTVTPVNDTAVEPDETVVVTLSASAAYTVGAPSSATVTIQSDDLALPGVTIAATDATATETRYDDGAVHGDAHRRDDGGADGELTVGGTATAGSDYAALAGSVQIRRARRRRR